ncbi:hypothetical protein LRP67_11265 [Nocardioides sp. cx-169]|uniref:hypothetical protein n=1 Tax=Nocardioides sp. cx-169 TaxID=2899080 RepID=UPI001E577031|nr:hypothetical protein [Nocardioides sp. cx-169]MCD4534661.1 hypothetical protein [Nocardioides sp. cx-169]
MTPYEELTSPQEMRADCEAAGRRLRLEAHLARAAAAAARPAPSIHFADFPRELPKREIRISDAATRIANALHLHLD